MEIAVRYFTRSGNTKALADAVAEAVGVSAADVSEPLAARVDVLFLGSSVYGADFDPDVGTFLDENADRIGTVVCFGTSATGKSTFKKIRVRAELNGLRVWDDNFNCPGRFLFLHKSRPNREDLEAAAVFAGSVLASLPEQEQA